MRNITAIAVASASRASASFAATPIPTIELAAAKKKVDFTDPKNAKNKACKATMDKKTDQLDHFLGRQEEGRLQRSEERR
jgi:hypothetical protein